MPRPHVLVADDNRKLRELLHYVLGREGFRVSLAGNGREALEACRRAPPDIVVLDVLMPDLDGFSVCRALRREDQQVFDRLFALSKRHMAEAAYAARPVPFDALVITILLEQQKELERLRRQLDSRPAVVCSQSPQGADPGHDPTGDPTHDGR